MKKTTRLTLIAAAFATISSAAFAAPETYTIDSCIRFRVSLTATLAIRSS